MANEVDISENLLLETHPLVLKELLMDHTTQKNIFWATDSYSHMGEGFNFFDEITIESITGNNGRVIQPRVVKDATIQTQRVKDKAEVFTPSWMCNAQNNLIDEKWFGRKDVFNVENIQDHTWYPQIEKITFPKDKTWKEYVRELRLEVACGEGPYLVSRYDSVTGTAIVDLSMRIGILDRKLRIVSENTHTSGEWIKWGKEALKSTYGFEWQGDNLILAREAVFYTFCDYYKEKFSKNVPTVSLLSIANIISWNIWQMDGLKLVVPSSCERTYIKTLWGEYEKKECPACKSGEMIGHIGIKCKIRDWKYTGVKEDKKTPYFSSLLNSR